MLKTIFSIIFLIYYSTSSFAQIIDLEYWEDPIVGPESVSMHTEAQIEYYTKEYLEIVKTLEDNIHINENILLEINSITRRLKRAERKDLEEFPLEIETINRDIEKIQNVIIAWDEELNYLKDNQSFYSTYTKNNCLELNANDQYYLPGEYIVEDLSLNDSLMWFEYKEYNNFCAKIKKADWEILKESDYIIKNKIIDIKENQEAYLVYHQTCPEGFDTLNDVICFRRVIIPHDDKTNQRIIIIDKLTGKEIDILEFKEVSCQSNKQ